MFSQASRAVAVAVAVISVMSPHLTKPVINCLVHGHTQQSLSLVKKYRLKRDTIEHIINYFCF